MKTFNNYILEKLKIDRNTKISKNGKWTFEINLDIISIMYTGGNEFNENDKATKQDIKGLFEEVIEYMTNIHFDEHDIDLKITNKFITLSNINESSLMFAIENTIAALVNICPVYVDDIKSVVPMDQIEKEVEPELRDKFEKYIYDNVES